MTGRRPPRSRLRRRALPPSASIMMPAVQRPPTILIFDCGLGGLTVFREIVRARPDARFVYAADDAGFPYGRLPEEALVARVVAVMAAAHRSAIAPDLVVIACNTASTLVLPALRAHFAMPFVGTVPAIKPACAASHRGASRCSAPRHRAARIHARADPQFRRGCDVTLVGSARLAASPKPQLRGRAGRRRRRSAPRSRPASSTGRRAHRHGRARLHALSAAARPFRARSRPGRYLDRSGARDRAPRGRTGSGAAIAAACPSAQARAVFTSRRASTPALPRVLAALAASALMPSSRCRCRRI